MAPTWASANKDGIGTAIAATSRVWFTCARGNLTEVFYPSPDRARLRDLALIVTSAEGDAHEAGRETEVEIVELDGPAPVYAAVHDLRDGARLVQEIVADPASDTVLVRVRFTPGTGGAYRLFCVLAPRLGATGDGAQRVWPAAPHGVRALLAADDHVALALTSAPPPLAVAISGDGRASIRACGARGTALDGADGAAVAEPELVAELRVPGIGESLVLAVAFAPTGDQAAALADGSLHRGYAAARAAYVAEWEQWHASLCAPGADGALWTRSTTVLETLHAKTSRGGIVAALATPWGPERGRDQDGTYHMVWTRDLVESASALIAAGAHDVVGHVLAYLRRTQERDGHWPQNMMIDGTPVWNNDELDEAALPLVLFGLACREHLLDEAAVREMWPFVRDAASFLVRTGPSTTRDRWEDTSGITPFTVGTEIVALLAAARACDDLGETDSADVLRSFADEWTASIDGWLYRRGGALAEHVGVAGYYVRARAPDQPFPRLDDLAHLPATEVSPDALALVRFGLRAADDPRIVDTVRVIDAVLAADLPGGRAWRRYPGDGYGEHADGRGFDGSPGGIGRPWPLLALERAHYELARGDHAAARALRVAVEQFANAGGYLPEQIWDAADLPTRGLVRGQATGSAAPLGWAHAEYVKLCRSLAEGAVFDLPRHAHARYVGGHATPAWTTWRVGEIAPIVPAGRGLRLACPAPAHVRWGCGERDVARTRDAHTRATSLGLHVVELRPDVRAGARAIALEVHHEPPRPGDGEVHVFELGRELQRSAA